MLLILNNPNKKICLFDLNSADVGAGFSIELIDINLLPFFNCLIMNTDLYPILSCLVFVFVHNFFFKKKKKIYKQTKPPNGGVYFSILESI
jgi:hypothetical protein